MKNKKLLIVIAVVIFGAAAVFALAARTADQSTGQAETERGQPASLEFTIEPSNDSAEPTLAAPVTPEKTVALFMDNFLKTAPAFEESGAKERALALFTEGGRDLMPKANGEPHLGLWLGVQDFPDEGYEVGTTTFKDNPATGEAERLAEVMVTLKYSGDDTTRVFLLAKIEEGWLIDGVNQ